MLFHCRDAIRLLIDYGVWRVTSAPNPSFGKLKLIPSWDPFSGDPRFEKILAFLAPKVSAG
jgi:hypothetical protein